MCERVRKCFDTLVEGSPDPCVETFFFLDRPPPTPRTQIESNISRGPNDGRAKLSQRKTLSRIFFLLRKCVQYTSIIYLSLSDILVVSQIPLTRSLTRQDSRPEERGEAKFLSRPSTSFGFSSGLRRSGTRRNKKRRNKTLNGPREGKTRANQRTKQQYRCV